MGHTTIAFSESQDEAGVMSRMTAVPDQHIKTSGDKITVPQGYNQIIGMIACVGANGDEARLVSPSIRRVNPLYIVPPDLGLVPTAGRHDTLFPGNPIPLETNESLEAENDADPAAAEQHSVVVFLSDGVISPVSGSLRTVNASITMALVAGLWTFSELTFEDDLPVGDYAVVGARCVVAAGVAFRLVPVGGIYRPGAPCVSGIGGLDAHYTRKGGMGEWLVFNTVQPPSVEVLGSAAAGSATYEMYLDIIKRG